MQVGSDGKTACASCHFQAGEDSRTKNQVHPHGNGFSVGTGSNVLLQTGHFPVQSNDVVGSAGVVKETFNAIRLSFADDQGTSEPDGVFNLGGYNIRQVTGRNAPSAINAVYNVRNFWDGRARNTVNGVNILGDDDPNARIVTVDSLGNLSQVRLSLTPMSLASQALGPALSGVEMSWMDAPGPSSARRC